MRLTVPPLRAALAAALLLSLPVHSAGAQADSATRFSSAGAARAGRLVDDVFIARTQREAVAGAGDFASHLVERLGVRPVPDDLAMTVRAESTAVYISGRVRDLPPGTQRMLGPAMNFLDPNSLLVADVGLTRASPGVLRFRLRSLSVDGTALPEMLLGPMMAEVGRSVPALTKTGRDLLVAIPPGASIVLERGGFHLYGPPPGAPAAPAAPVAPAAPAPASGAGR